MVKYTNTLLLTSATDKPHAARQLLFQLPSDLLPSTVSETDSMQIIQVKEYLDYTAFFTCLEKHTRWAETWARKPTSKYVIEITSIFFSFF